MEDAGWCKIRTQEKMKETKHPLTRGSRGGGWPGDCKTSGQQSVPLFLLALQTAVQFFLQEKKFDGVIFHQRLNPWCSGACFSDKNFVDRGWLNLSSPLCPFFSTLYTKLAK